MYRKIKYTETNSAQPSKGCASAEVPFPHKANPCATARAQGLSTAQPSHTHNPYPKLAHNPWTARAQPAQPSRTTLPHNPGAQPLRTTQGVVCTRVFFSIQYSTGKPPHGNRNQSDYRLLVCYGIFFCFRMASRVLGLVGWLIGCLAGGRGLAGM